MRRASATMNSQKYNWNGYTEHGWIEKDGYVYDTTWRVFCPTDVYYNVFKPTCVDKRDSKRFFEDCKEVSDWTIRDKQWYENNYSPLPRSMLIPPKLTKTSASFGQISWLICQTPSWRRILNLNKTSSPLGCFFFKLTAPCPKVVAPFAPIN